jgi:hypothetical protein
MSGLCGRRRIAGGVAAQPPPAQSRGDEVMRMADTTKDDRPARASNAKRLRLVRLIGPGLITGASDDDPSASVFPLP